MKSQKQRRFSRPSARPKGGPSAGPTGPKRPTLGPMIEVEEQVQFPAAWTWFVDELLPNLAKNRYSPRESWKGKPFTKEDAAFFSKGVEELSDLFTEDRPTKGMVPYFQHPKYRCGYLLYFLPLQAAKFLTLLHLHPQAFEALLKHGKKEGVLRIVDLGCGPGTASISILLALLEAKIPASEIPPIELHWFDTNSDIMHDGKALVEALADQFSRLRGKVSVKVNLVPWWKALPKIPERSGLVIMGHVLNEATIPHQMSDPFWEPLLQNLSGAGLLIAEPAAKRSSQSLSHLRDQILEWIAGAGEEGQAAEPSQQRLWGPCLHAGRCPLADGRDWCHFSSPSRIPGKWFKYFSEGLGSERQWLKFSYLWVASADYLAPKRNPKERLVVSDPLGREGEAAAHLLCEPQTPRRWIAPRGSLVRRGNVIKLNTE